MAHQGDFDTSDIVDFKFTTVTTTGAPTQLAGTPAISVYKDNSTTQTTTGVTLTVDFDTVTGLNHVRIDTSADGTFYSAGSDFTAVITTGTVGGTSVVGYVVGSFSLRNRANLYPTTAGRTLDVSAGGEAGVDWANVGSPTTTVTLSGTTVKTATDVETDTQDIQSRLPAALVGGRIDANVGAISSDATAADNLEAAYDGTGYAHTGNTYPWTAAWDAEVQSEVQDALEANHLDHLIAVADPGGVVANSSFLAKLVSKSATPAFSSFDNTTDSLEALRDNVGTSGAALSNVSANVAQWSGSAVATVDAAGYPVVTIKDGTGQGELNITSGVVDAKLADGVSHGGTLGSSTATLALSRLSVVSQSNNTSAVTLTGLGTGHGMNIAGGTTGHGILSQASGSSRHGMSLTGGGTNGAGLSCASTVSHGIVATGGGAGDGMSLAGGSSAGAGFHATGGTSGNGATFDAGSGGVDIDGNLSGSVTSVTNTVSADVVSISGDSAAADNLESYTDGTTPIPANATQLSGDATAADNAESFFDGTGYAGTNNVIPTVTTLSSFATAFATALTAAMTESYRSAGATGSVAQLLYEIIAHLGESSISGTTKTLKKLDGSTTAKTYTLDSATTPTSITETT